MRTLHHHRAVCGYVGEPNWDQKNHAADPYIDLWGQINVYCCLLPQSGYLLLSYIVPIHNWYQRLHEAVIFNKATKNEENCDRQCKQGGFQAERTAWIKPWSRLSEIYSQKGDSSAQRKKSQSFTMTLSCYHSKNGSRRVVVLQTSSPIERGFILTQGSLDAGAVE